MTRLYSLTFLLFCCLSAILQAQQDSSQQIQIVPVPPAARVADYSLTAVDGYLVFRAEGAQGTAAVTINGEETPLLFDQGVARVPVETDLRGGLKLVKSEATGYRMYHLSQRADGQYRLRPIPMWLSVLPPLIAILLALVFKEVMVSLFVGVWAGAFIAGGLRLESVYFVLLSFWEVVEKYIVKALNDTGHLSVIVFSLLIGGMVAIISRNGGMAGVVKSLSRYARSKRSAQFITWLLGVAIFFDDYANTLIVGNTMRPVTDKFRVSREKLAYIVDSTAAPVAAVAFITTWIGAELGYIDDAVKGLAGFDAGLTPYAIFIASLKYSFYPVLTLAFILMVIYMKRDFGAMHQAELRTVAAPEGEVYDASGGQSGHSAEDLTPVKGAPLKGYNAVLPVLTVIFMTLFGLLETGMASLYGELVSKGVALQQTWGDIWRAMPALMPEDSPGLLIKLGKVIGSSDSYVALLWASLSGVVVAMALTLAGRIMRLGEVVNTMLTGFKTMMPALLILTLAWSLAGTTEALHTATFLTTALQDSINPYMMPPIIFVLAALISFSTGSSWSTMAILYPIAVPTTWAICLSAGLAPDVSMELLLNVIATVLAASVLGDHCSPISDTTILSSLSSDCNHIDHVRTQMPYALTVGSVSLVAGTVSTMLGGGWGVSAVLLLLSLAVLAVVLRYVGQRID